MQDEYPEQPPGTVRICRTCKQTALTSVCVGVLDVPIDMMLIGTDFKTHKGKFPTP